MSQRLLRRFGLAAGLALSLALLASCATGSNEPVRRGAQCWDGEPLVHCCAGHRGVDHVMEDGTVVCRDRAISQICHCKARH